MKFSNKQFQVDRLQVTCQAKVSGSGLLGFHMGLCMKSAKRFEVDFGRIWGYVVPLLPCRFAFWRSFCVFGTVFDLILFRLQGQGGASRRCIPGLFLTMPKEHGPMAPYSLQHSPKIAEVGPKMAPT